MRPEKNTQTGSRLFVRSILCSLASVMLMIAAPTQPAHSQTRIKDIVDFEGVRENILVGYGLVVGLNGTGDGLNSAIFTRESLVGMLERLGVNARDDNLNTDHVAAVMVTATLPPFARQGSRIDVSVSAIGDAEDLLGGTLLVTPLVGADGEVYAFTVMVNGFERSGPVRAFHDAFGSALLAYTGAPPESAAEAE